MSGKKSNELAIQGRRLRPIYDALDNGQNKKAIQETEKVLKKHPGTHAAKALKALALIRTERTAEAFSLISGLEDEIKTSIYDENLIQAVCHCYKEGFMPERIVKLYECLAKNNPNDENILSQLFLAHARVGNYKEQQRIALQLYKEFNATPYLMWSIMSMVMQGLNDNKMGSAMFYPLAEKMMNKLIDNYSFKGEEMDLYLIVLELRGKLDHAIKYVEQNTTFSNDPVYGTKSYHYLNRLYFMNKNFQTLIERAWSCLEKDCNDWTSWQYFLDGYMHVIEEAATVDPTYENLKPILEKLVSACAKLVKQSKDSGESHTQRGPLLACLEVISRLRRCQHFTPEQITALPGLETPVEILKQLIACLHMKPYCFSDVKLYLHLINANDYKVLIKYTDDLRPDWNDENENQVNKDIHFVENNWNDLLKEELVWAQITHDKTAISLEKRTAHVRKLFAKLPPSHFQAGQVASLYGSLIAGYLLENENSIISAEHVLTMIIVLEHIRRTYTDCDRSVLVLLARLYTIFGDVSRVTDLCCQLDIKYIQRDSLGFMKFFLAERFGRFRTAIFFYTSISAQYDQGEREIAECCVNAYKNGSFSQITKLVDFQKKCVHSVYSTVTDVMNRAFSSIFGVDSLDVAGSTIFGDDSNIDWDNLCDNRDFSVVSGMPCNCCSDHMDTIKNNSFGEMVAAMKLQHHFCRTIGILSRENVSAASFQTEYDIYQKHLEEAKKIAEDNKEKKLAISNFSYLNMMSVLHEGYFDIPTFVFNLIKKILQNVNHAKNGTISSSGLPNIDEFASILKTVITSKMPEKAEEISLWNFIELLEACASSLQILVSCLLALKFFEQRLAVFGKSNGKAEKDGKFVSENEQKTEKNSNIIDLLLKYQNEIVEALKKVRTTLSSYLAALDEELNATDKQSAATVVHFPELVIDMLIDSSDKSEEAEKMRATLAELRRNIEISMKNSYVQGLQESLGVLLRADTKLLGSSTNSLLKWPKLLVDSLVKLNI